MRSGAGQERCGTLGDQAPGMSALRKPNLVAFTLTGIGIVLLWVCSNVYWGGENYRTVLQSDAKGYYAYLPAIFIYDDLQFGFFEDMDRGKYYNPDLLYEYRIHFNGVSVNKYYCGTALAQAPFFLAAHGMTEALGGDADGYSRLYVVFLHIGAIVHALLGLWVLDKLLRAYGVAEPARAVTLIALAFGTHLFYYILVAPGMSHVWSFLYCTLFLYSSHRYFREPTGGRVVMLGLLLGIIVLIRPINGLILASWPFLAGSLNAFCSGMRSALAQWRYSIVAAVLFSLVVSIQFVLYKLGTGSFFIYSYKEEWFNWLDPQMLNILFSYKKGLFLYTPILLLATVGGLWVLARRNAYEAITWALFFLLITYFFSAWWNWWYGGSFSGRPYVEYLAMFGILLGVGLGALRKKGLRAASYAVLFLLILVCQVQTMQTRYFQIHYEEMTKERYWDVFLRLDRLP
ncbi:MAG: hypothetical protein IPK99_11420 [Flavobacteriales bacterium]|nr:hypothetical protein [Flavobacteriales bacterium]